jgi:hypothetical protein
MPGLEPGIHIFGTARKKGVDGRVKPGHDEVRETITEFLAPAFAAWRRTPPSSEAAACPERRCQAFRIIGADTADITGCQP